MPTTDLAVVHKPSVIMKLGSKFGVEQNNLMDTLKATAFKGTATNEQMVALCIVADQYGLNPFTKEIYAFPDKQNGIVPVVGVDGWSRIINSNAEFDGIEFDQDEDSCTCRIFRKDRAHSVEVTEYLDECKRNTGPWTSHPRRMLRHKAMIQAARLAFGYVGIYDKDEAERIIETGTVDHAYEPIPMPTALPPAQAKPAAGKPATADKKRKPSVTDPAPKKPEANIVEGIVTGIRYSQSKPDAKKPWEKWGVTIDGTTYGTFDQEKGELAKEFKDEGTPVSLTVEQNGKYMNLLTIEALKPTPPEQGVTPQNEGELTEEEKAEIEEREAIKGEDKDLDRLL